MAAAFFNRFADAWKAQAISAGTEPAEHVHPEVVEAMSEVGFDLEETKPRKLTEAVAQTAALLVTMGCGEACPVIAGLERQDWSFDDPQTASPEEVRAIRDAIHKKVEELVVTNGWTRT
jgi:arsenate reductase